MEHQRHRAPEAHHRRSLIVTGIVATTVGLVVGASGVAAGWWLTADSGAGTAMPSATPLSGTASGSGEGRSAESESEREIPTLAPRSTGSTDPVLLLGDSLAVGITPYVDAGLDDRTLTVDAAEGRGTATSLSLLEPYAATSPPVWLVSLGTNDNVDEFEHEAEQVMKLAGPNRCVVWFDVWRVDTDDSINASLDRVADDHPNLHLIPWNGTSAAHPEWFSDADVHPSSVGYAVRGQMGVDALTYYCG